MKSTLVRLIALPVLLLTAVAILPSAEKQEGTGELLSIVVAKGLDGVASHRWSVFTVQVGNLIYTGTGNRIRHPLDDYNEGYNAGDAVRAEIRGNEMTIKKPGGKTIKTKIMKRISTDEQLN